MQFQTLGGSELRVSRLCMGTMNFGTQVDQATAHAILDRAFEVGYTFLDTAEMYAVPPSREVQGLPEAWMGTWMKGRARDKVIVATKVTGPGQMSWILEKRVPSSPPAPTRLDRAAIQAAVEGSLQRLQIDYIDLYQVHWPARYVGGLFGDGRYRPELERDPSADFEEVARTMDDLIQAGKIRTWGLSNETSFGLCQYEQACRLGGYAKPISIQNDFSLMNRTFEPELAETCAPRNLHMHLLVYGALAGGALSGKYLKDPKAPGRHSQYPRFQPRYTAAPAQEATAKYVALAEDLGLTGTELALAWTLAQPYVGSVITGASHPDQIGEHARATEVKLDASTLRALDRIHAERQNPCNWTNELMS